MELLTPQLADFRRGQSESLLRAQSPPRNISEIRNSLKLDRAGLSDRAISVLKGKSTAHAKNETGFDRFRNRFPMELDHPAPGEPSVRSAAGSCRASEARVGQGPSETRKERTTKRATAITSANETNAACTSTQDNQRHVHRQQSDKVKPHN